MKLSGKLQNLKELIEIYGDVKIKDLILKAQNI